MTAFRQEALFISKMSLLRPIIGFLEKMTLESFESVARRLDFCHFQTFHLYKAERSGLSLLGDLVSNAIYTYASSSDASPLPLASIERRF